MYSWTCLIWSPVGPHVQWDLSNMVTYICLAFVFYRFPSPQVVGLGQVTHYKNKKPTRLMWCQLILYACCSSSILYMSSPFYSVRMLFLFHSVHVVPLPFCTRLVPLPFCTCRPPSILYTSCASSILYMSSLFHFVHVLTHFHSVHVS